MEPITSLSVLVAMTQRKQLGSESMWKSLIQQDLRVDNPTDPRTRVFIKMANLKLDIDRTLKVADIFYMDFNFTIKTFIKSIIQRSAQLYLCFI